MVVCFTGISDIADVVMFSFGTVFTLALLLIPPTETVDSSYVAAVYEHNLILNPDPRVPLSRLEALQHLQKNLDIFEDQAARAAQQVLILVLSVLVSKLVYFATSLLQPVLLSISAAVSNFATPVHA